MAVLRLNNKNNQDNNNNQPTAGIWSPVAWTDEIANEIQDHVGPVSGIVAPNQLHWTFLKQWHDKYPNAKVYAAPGLQGRKCVQNIQFSGTLSNTPEPLYANDLDQILMQSGMFTEAIFFHKPSQTVLFCDMIQRHSQHSLTGWRKFVVTRANMLGPDGGAPPDALALFWLAGLLPMVRKVIDHIVLQWQPRGLIIAHGEMATEDAISIIAHAFRAVPEQPRECICCCLARSRVCVDTE